MPVIVGPAIVKFAMLPLPIMYDIAEPVVFVYLKLLKVCPPVLQVGPSPVKFIVDVLALNVRPVETLKLRALAVDDKFIVELPKVSVLVPVAVVQDKWEQVKFPVLKVPLVKVTVLVVVKAPPSVQPPPTPLNTVGLAKETPLVVIVLPVAVALKVIVPVVDQTVAATKLMLPLIAKLGVVPDANVTVPADTVISRHVKAPVQVTV